MRVGDETGDDDDIKKVTITIRERNQAKHVGATHFVSPRTTKQNKKCQTTTVTSDTTGNKDIKIAFSLATILNNYQNLMSQIDTTFTAYVPSNKQKIKQKYV